MKYALMVASTVLAFALGASAMAATQTITLTPDQIKWGPAKGLPPDWQGAALAGDSTKKGAYVERVKIPPNAMIPPHMHPDTENITVLSGTFGIGQGTSGDKSKGQMLPAGSFYRLPAHTAHYAWTGADGAVIQIHGIGPSAIQMIKPKVPSKP